MRWIANFFALAGLVVSLPLVPWFWAQRADGRVPTTVMTMNSAISSCAAPHEGLGALQDGENVEIGDCNIGRHRAHGGRTTQDAAWKPPHVRGNELDQSRRGETP